jgi:hypothetical protein
MTRQEYITNKQIPEELIMRLIKNAHTLCTTAQQLNKCTYVFLSLAKWSRVKNVIGDVLNLDYQ